MSDEELQYLVEQISLDYFSRPFMHRAFFNTRLQTTGGRYHLKTHDIDFNPKILEKFGINELVGVIKHELCHYHLHLLNKGYRHQDKDFKQLLRQVGGSRYVKSVREVKKWQYQCTGCATILQRHRKFDTNKYVCRYCQHKFILLTHE